jgi:hypothetical protein
MTPPEGVDECTKKMIKQLQKIAKRLNMTPCITSLQRNGSTSGKDKKSGRPVDVIYCILEHGKQDPSVRPLLNWML